MAGHKQSQLPGFVQAAMAGAIRTAMSPVLIAGMEPSVRASQMLARVYPRIQPSRFNRAVQNIRDAYPQWDDEQVRRMATNAYGHLFRLGVELMHIPRVMTEEGFSRHLVFTNVKPALRQLLESKPCILISGHVGNWELIGYAISMLGFPMHAVYRPLDLKPLDRWVHETRERRGLSLVSKFGAVRALPPVLKAGRPVGLVADQSGGDRGVFTPFFGRLTSTYKSVGLLAMQVDATLICGFARRMAPGEPIPDGAWSNTPAAGRQFDPGMRYSVEMVDQFGPEEYRNQPDPLYYLTARYRRAIENMVRRAPDQYFWMHRMWRSRPAHERHNKPFPPQLREKLLSLPWMSAADVDAVVERSRLDTLALHPT